jgi:hypothetical protein
MARAGEAEHDIGGRQEERRRSRAPHGSARLGQPRSVCRSKPYLHRKHWLDDSLDNTIDGVLFAREAAAKVFEFRMVSELHFAFRVDGVR